MPPAQLPYIKTKHNTDSVLAAFVPDSLPDNSADTVNASEVSHFFSELPGAYPLIKNKISNNTDIITVFFFFGFLLIAMANVANRARFIQLFKAFWNRNYTNQIDREGFLFNEKTGVLLFINYCITMMLLFFESGSYFFADKKEPLGLYSLLFYTLLFIVGYWLLKVFMIRVISMLFKTAKASEELLLNFFIFNLIAGLLILPLTALYFYTGAVFFLFSALCVFLILYMYRFFRAWMAGLSHSIFSILHLFLYLCTLEILPMLTVIKIMAKYYAV